MPNRLNAKNIKVVNAPKYDWQVVMSFVYNHKEGYGNKNRPRRMSIHSIAAVCERDPNVILNEMEKSDAVLGYCCPDVGESPIFYLKELRGIMTDTPTANAFKTAAEWLVKYPFPKYQGFQRHVDKDKFAMACPFDEADADYEKQLRANLAEWRGSK